MVAVGSVGVGLWLAARSGEDEAVDQLVAVGSDPGLVHVHGLVVDPADGRLFAATHTGVFRLDDGAPARVANRYQDTMGFSAVGPSTFLASGHPDLRDRSLRVEGRPPLLGLIRSTDAAVTWEPQSLLGEADLHAIAADDDVILAYDSTGERVLASDDGGAAWETRSEIPLVDLALHPTNVDAVVAAAPDAGVLLSNDGGRSWDAAIGAPRNVTAVRWGVDGVWAGTEDGAIARLDAAGAWRDVHRFEGAVEALLVDGSTAYVAIAGEGILRSDDGGTSWTSVYRTP